MGGRDKGKRENVAGKLVGARVGGGGSAGMMMFHFSIENMHDPLPL